VALGEPYQPAAKKAAATAKKNAIAAAMDHSGLSSEFFMMDLD
jgi:hypothetical protein